MIHRRATIPRILLPAPRQPPPLPKALRLLAISVLAAGAARAGEAPSPLEGKTRVELSYAVAIRSSDQTGGSTRIRFGGLSPSFLRLSGAHFLSPWLGVAGDLGYETFGVTGTGFQATQVRRGLQAGQLTLAGLGRWQPLSQLSLEGQLGYLLGTLPILVPGSTDVEGGSVFLSGPHLAAGARYQPLPPLTLLLGARVMPFGLGVQTPLGRNSQAAQLSFTLGATWTAFGAGPAWLAVGLDSELQVAQVVNGAGYSLQQRALRLGLAVRAWLPERAPAPAPGLDRPLPGRLRGRVVRDGSQPIPGATVALAGREPLVTLADGSFALDELPAGPLELTVTAAGFKARAESVTITAGGQVELTVTLAAPSGPGRIRGVAFAAAGPKGAERQPLASATVEGPSGSIVTGEDGSFSLEGVGPGPVAVKATARGYQAAEEVVSVPAEGEAQVELTLNREAVRVLASMRGQVRTLRGKPVSAQLRIPEAQINTRTASDGRFHVRVPGGKYTVVFEAKGYVRQSKVVEVADGDQAIFYVDLSREDR